VRQSASIVIAASFAIIGVAYLTAGRQYPVMQNDQPGPGLYPLLVGVFWVVAGTACTVEVWRERHIAALALEWPDRAGWQRILVIFISCFAYVAMVGILGNFLMSFLVILAVTRSMGMRRPLPLLATAAGMATIWHLLFVTALHVPLPQGLWVG
jgi:hypothetical protein